MVWVGASVLPCRKEWKNFGGRRRVREALRLWSSAGRTSLWQEGARRQHLFPGLCMGFLLKHPDIQVETSPRTSACVGGGTFCPALLQAPWSRRIYSADLCLLFPSGSLYGAPAQHVDHFCHLLGHIPLSMYPARSGRVRSWPLGATWAPAQVCVPLMDT